MKGAHWIWCGSRMLLTTDGGQSWSKDALPGGSTCEAEYTIRGFVPAANGKYCLGSRNGVLSSADGKAWQHGTQGGAVASWGFPHRWRPVNANV